MATYNGVVDKGGNKAPISQRTHDALIDHIKAIRNHTGNAFAQTIERIDLLYYNANKLTNGAGRVPAHIMTRMEEVGLTADDLVDSPLMYSQINTAQAALCDTFLQAYPIFGVVGAPEQRQGIEQLEALIAHYTAKGKWVSQLQAFFNGVCMYNTVPLGLLTDYSLSFADSANIKDTQRPATVTDVYPSIFMPDPYNLILDTRVPPTQMAQHAEIFGYSEMVPAVQLKTEIEAVRNTSSKEAGRLLNLDKLWDGCANGLDKYYTRPIVRNILPVVTDSASSPWANWLYGSTAVQDNTRQMFKGNYVLRTRVWLRAIPRDFMIAPFDTIPTVYELWIANMEYIYYIKPVYLENNSFPFCMVDMANSGYGYNAPTEPEMLAPFQKVSTVLLNVLMQGAMRVVADRFAFDKNYIDPANLTGVGGNIPFEKSLAADKSVDQILRQLPFEANSLAAIPGVLQQLSQITYSIKGRNDMMQGVHRKGNRTLGEYQDVQGNANVRQQIQPMQIESQAMTHVHMMLKNWIAAHAKPMTLLNTRTRAPLEIDPAMLQSLAYELRLSTGYHGKDLIVNTDFLTALTQWMGNSPELQQAYDVPETIAYLASLQNVRDLDQLRRQATGQPAPAMPVAPTEGVV